MAALATALLHAGLGWFASTTPTTATVAPGPRMELVLIRRVAPGRVDAEVAAPAVAPASRPADGAPAPLSARFVARRDRGPPATVQPPTRVTTLDDRWTRPGDVAGARRFRPDPFERRPAPLPGGGTHRFRMRPPRSPADAVAGAAMLLGLRPPGFDASACPRIARNVSALATSVDPGDRAALAHELAMQDSLCR